MSSTPFRARWSWATALCLTFLAAACSGSDSEGTGPDPDPDPDPTLSVSVQPTSLQLEQGESGTLTVTLARGGGFAGAVTLAASGLPAGVTIGGATVASGATQAQLTVQASSNASPGAATVTIQANGAGVSANATVALQIDEKPVGTFALALAPSEVELTQGATAEVAVTLDRSGGFAGSVELAVTGAPTGLTAALGSTTLSGDATELVLTAASDLAAGDYTLTVAATGEGTEAREAQVVVTVVETSAGSFEISLAPASLSVQQGASASSTVTIDRSGGYAGAVTLGVENVPAGVSVQLSETSVAGTEATIQVDVGAGTVVGAFTLTVRASGTGVADRTADLGLDVTSAPVGDTGTWSFCPDVPIWFAVRNGDGAWSQVVPTGNRFDFTMTSDRVSVAWVKMIAGDPEMTILYGSQAEIERYGEQQCSGDRTVQVSVPGLGVMNQAYLSLGGSAVVVAGAAGTQGTFENVSEGPIDLFGARTELQISGSTVNTVVDRLFLSRNLDPADGSSITVDFAGPSAFAPEQRSVTAVGLGGESALLTMLYLTPGNTGVMFTETAFTGTATRTFPAVPGARQETEDLHGLTLTTEPSNGTTGDYRAASIYFKDPTDRQVTFGPLLAATDFSTEATSPYLRPRVQYTRQNEYDKYWSVSYRQGDRGVSMLVTDDYQGSDDIDLTLPDFSGVAGWDPTWGLQPATQVTFAFVASGWPGEGVVGPVELAEGLVVQTGTRTGTFNP